MVACDQPFEEVERPEFIAAMSYGRPSKFTLPKRDGVRRRVMKLGEVTVQEIKDMFAVIFSLLSCNVLMFFWQNLEGKISLSLDAWTSSNCYAFLAIIAHYITNQGQCGESLNNFSYLTSHNFSTGRGATHRLPGVNRTALRRKYGNRSMVNPGDLWHPEQGSSHLYIYNSSQSLCR